MKDIIARHRAIWPQAGFIRSSLLSLVFLAISLGINYFAGQYADLNASNTVTDIILDRLPVMDVEFLFIYGFGLFLMFVMVLIVLEPKRLPFVFKSLAILIAIRSFFVILTHLAPLSSISPSDMGSIARRLTFSADLFFSAHTGIPFLFSLIFWKHKILRLVFLGFSIFFAVIVLLGHLHYSIDVFAAYFITFTIYSIAKKFFPSDEKCFNAVG